MEMKILAKAAQKIFEGEGGMYYNWSSADSPILADTKLGGSKLVLHPFGLALPHYADSSKVGHVLEGSGRVGVILPRASEEKVLNLKKGDIIPLPCGSISWWFNDADSDFTVVFLGETSKAYTAGEITYFFLAGTHSILHGLSTELLSKAWGLNEEDVIKITKSQTGVLIVKLKQSQSLPEPCKADTDKIVINTEKDENLVVVTSEELPLLKQVGLSTVVVKLQGNAIHAPEYLPDSSFQMIYVERGSGRFQVAGIDGKSVLDDMIEAGQLLVVPRFFSCFNCCRWRRDGLFFYHHNTTAFVWYISWEKISLESFISTSITGFSECISRVRGTFQGKYEQRWSYPSYTKLSGRYHLCADHKLGLASSTNMETVSS